MPSLDEASRCPKCKFPGENTSTLPARTSKGVPVKQHIYMCRNERCKWLDTGWTVTELPDGTVPEPAPLSNKSFQPYTPGQISYAERMIENAIQADLRDREQ